jgi:phage replication O-like protein O
MMTLEKTTPVPNAVLDAYLMNLKYAELKVLLVVIRQTYGWVHPKNPKKRKEFDRITIETFVKKTGCSRRAVSDAIDSLIKEHLIDVLDYDGNCLMAPSHRKGKSFLYYKPKLQKPMQNLPISCANFSKKPVQKLHISKESNLKKTETNAETNSFYKINKHKFAHITQFLNTINI